MIEPKDIKKIVIVESLGSAYYLDEHGNLLFTPIGQYNGRRGLMNRLQISYANQGGNIYDDWDEVDLELVGDEINYEPIIKALGGE
jgi:hypothetical protein